MADSPQPILVTGLDASDCFARFRDLFGECANDYYHGCYDDQKRVRANFWWAAYRSMKVSVQ